MEKRSQRINLAWALGLFLAASRGYAADAEKGKLIFDQHACVKCHAVTSKEEGKPGPSLFGISGTRKHDWLKKFIANPADFKTDPAIKTQMKKFPVGMPPSKLSDSEVSDLLSFLDQLK